MSKLKAQGNASGTGVFTLQTPPTNTDRTISLPDSTGTLVDTTGATFTGGVTGTDVTLSGGLYVGGTGSANYLDDYEEGTFDPTFTGTSGGTAGNTSGTYRLFYTKVGNIVHIQGSYYVTSVSGVSGTLRMNLPFSTATNNQGASYTSFKISTYSVNACGDTGVVGITIPSSSYVEIYGERDAGTRCNQIGTGYYYFNFSYRTPA